MSRSVTTVNLLDHINTLKSARFGSSLSTEVIFDGELSEYLIVFNKGFDSLLCFVVKRDNPEKSISSWRGSFTLKPFDQVFESLLQLAIKYLETV